MTERHPLASTVRLQGKELDNNDLEMLSGIIQRYWKHMFTKDESEKEVALTRFIQDYYEHVPKGHSFEDFYHYVDGNYKTILERKNVAGKYFDLESFKLNCGEFLPGQRYENVCKDTKIDFSGKKFIVFEADPDQAGQVSEQPCHEHDLYNHTKEATFLTEVKEAY